MNIIQFNVCSMWCMQLFEMYWTRNQNPFKNWLYFENVIILVFVPMGMFTFSLSGVVLVRTSSENARNGVRSEFTGWKLDSSSQHFNARFFHNEKRWTNDNMIEKKRDHVVFRETTSLRSYTGHTKVGKNKSN